MLNSADGWNLYNSLRDIDYGYIIPSVDLKAESQYQVIQFIQCKWVYHFYSFLNLSDLGMRQITSSYIVINAFSCHTHGKSKASRNNVLTLQLFIMQIVAPHCCCLWVLEWDRLIILFIQHHKFAGYFTQNYKK